MLICCNLNIFGKLIIHCVLCWGGLWLNYFQLSRCSCCHQRKGRKSLKRKFIEKLWIHFSMKLFNSRIFPTPTPSTRPWCSLFSTTTDSPSMIGSERFVFLPLKTRNKFSDCHGNLAVSDLLFKSEIISRPDLSKIYLLHLCSEPSRQ